MVALSLHVFDGWPVHGRTCSGQILNAMNHSRQMQARSNRLFGMHRNCDQTSVIKCFEMYMENDADCEHSFEENL